MIIREQAYQEGKALAELQRALEVLPDGGAGTGVRQGGQRAGAVLDCSQDERTVLMEGTWLAARIASPFFS